MWDFIERKKKKKSRISLGFEERNRVNYLVSRNYLVDRLSAYSIVGVFAWMFEKHLSRSVNELYIYIDGRIIWTKGAGWILKIEHSEHVDTWLMIVGIFNSIFK